MAVTERTESGVRPFWSGTISFGLVSVPVYLFAAHRGSIALRMLDKDGTPVRRRYYCPKHKRDIHREHILRGYEVAEEEYVVVRDEELEAIAPRKSRDIDLRRFVDRSLIPPLFLERSFFLAPASETNKAYRLLAAVMEQTGKAGVATFVMRDKEYLVAILAENGILRAQTLRFADEVLDPEKVGLSDKSPVSSQRVSELEKAIKKMTRDELNVDDLKDHYAERLSQFIDDKWKRKEDVVETETADEDEEEEELVGNTSLIEAIRRSLQAPENGNHNGHGHGNGHGHKNGHNKGGRKKSSPRARKGADLSDSPKEELYDRAKRLDIPGRSQMSKEELIRAIRNRS